MSTPDAAANGESLAETAARIRAAAPIVGERATDADCRLRNQLIADTLQARGIHPGPHIWHTGQLIDGHVVGVWANSVQEAELDLTVGWGRACHWVIPDPDSRVHQEYFPRGKRSATEANRSFPLGPPCRPRDRFAPAASLLDALGTPDVSRAGLER